MVRIVWSACTILRSVHCGVPCHPSVYGSLLAVTETFFRRCSTKFHRITWTLGSALQSSSSHCGTSFPNHETECCENVGTSWGWLSDSTATQCMVSTVAVFSLRVRLCLYDVVWETGRECSDLAVKVACHLLSAMTLQIMQCDWSIHRPLVEIQWRGDLRSILLESGDQFVMTDSQISLQK